MLVRAHRRGLWLGGLLVATIGCRPEPTLSQNLPVLDAAIVDTQGGDAGDGCAEPGAPVDIDMLLVVGSGERSAATQAALFDNLESLFEQLTCSLGVEPNLHLGAISTDLGSGGFELPRCDGSGDDALLLETAQVAGCTPPSDPYIIDVADGAGGRSRNFGGTLDDAVECIGRVGIDGCAFEQPIEAAVRATAPGKNPGFLRDDATLVIIFASGGDDCSVTDTDLFDPTEVATFGPLSSFRCFEFGALCTPDTPRIAGSKVACGARPQTTPLADVPALDAILRSRKADPADVVTAYVGGSPNDVTVTIDGGQPSLASSCPQPIDAAPPIRIGDLDNIGAASSCAVMPVDLEPMAEAIATALRD